jgi:hypothetical protein
MAAMTAATNSLGPRASRPSRRLIVAAALVIAGAALWPAPRYESGDQLLCTPGASYSAVRFDGLKVGGWSAEKVGGGSESGGIFIYPLVVLRTQAESRAVWFRKLAAPLSRGCNLDLR